MRKSLRKIVAVGVAACMSVAALSTLTACGNNNDDPNTFTWFINKDDSNGQQYYNNYNESMVVQYLNMLAWDTENGGIAKEGGENISFNFQTPAVEASDELATMFASGDTTDLIDLSTEVSTSPKQLVEEGLLMEITSYVNQYMPNYRSFIDANPDIKKFVAEKDSKGNYHYYALYQIADEPNDMYQGFIYRRDWIVKYGEMPDHVWNKEEVLRDQNDYTSVDTSKINYTSYAEAKEHNDWKGWIENTVVNFTSEDGADPDETYTDNVIFPSGNTDPRYISDWEWMLDIFKGHLGSALTNADKDKFALSIMQWGANGTGDFFSSFGGGNPMWYVKNGEVKFGAETSTMDAYLECMNTWYKRGYVDSKFNERNDDFWKINLSGMTSGKVAMGQYGMAYPGTAIREMSGDKDAMMFGCPQPINDMYGTAENKFTVPDSGYAAKLVNGATGISMNAADKNLPALFTALDYMYSEEGAVLLTFGLNGEQYSELKAHGIKGKNDYYASNGLTGGTYTVEDPEENDGRKYKRIQKISDDSNLQGAANGQRITTTLQINGKIISTYKKALRHAMDEWKRYPNSTETMLYTPLMDADASSAYSLINGTLTTAFSQNVPGFVKNGNYQSGKAKFIDALYSNDLSEARRYLQTVVDKVEKA